MEYEEEPITLPDGTCVPAAPGRYHVVPPPDFEEMLSERRFLLEYAFPHLIVHELAKPAAWCQEYMEAIWQTGAWQDENPAAGGYVSGSRSGYSLGFDSPPPGALRLQFIPDLSYIADRTWRGLATVDEKDRAYVRCVLSVVILIASHESTFEELQTKVSTFVAAGTHEGVVVDTRGDRVWIHNRDEPPYEAQPLAPVEFDAWPGFTFDCLAMRDARERAGLLAKLPNGIAQSRCKMTSFHLKRRQPNSRAQPSPISNNRPGAMSTDVNVKVAVRCRPMSSRETQMGAQSVVQVLEGVTIVIHPGATAGVSEGNSSASESSGKKQFTFDHAYGADSTQAQVYDDIARPTVEKALQGYNGTIFAYGQTGSGKTHSMMGGAAAGEEGIIPLMNVDLFARVDEAQRTHPELKFLVTVSFLEIYNEVIKDLLNPSDKLLKIREHPDMGIYVEQLAELVVKEAADVARLLEQGNKVRQVAATQMNERSSRSHSCFTVKIASKRSEEIAGGAVKETTMNAKINLVDLAGSERASKTGATGDRLKEGAAINKSLSALGNVINMLASDKVKGKSAHVPYRDSKLTRLLQESLGGNSLTVMVAAISPADYNFDESLSTLLYANRAKSIKNATRKNEDVNEKIIRELREEIERLRQLVVRPSSAVSVSEPSSEGGHFSNANSNSVAREMTTQMEETIANLERAKQQSWDEKQRLTELYEQERNNSLANDKKILGFMQTVKQEKMDIMRRIKALQQRKLQLAKHLRQRKQSYAVNKSKLQSDVETFQNKSASLSLVDKQQLMDAIESCKTLVIADRDEMARLKDELKACEEKLVDEEAEVAAQSALLEEDDKLRKAIQDDEREKMQHERALYLQAALEDERRHFQHEAEADKQQLHLALGATLDKEKKLLEEVELQRSKALTFQQHLLVAQAEHTQWRSETAATLSGMLARLKQDFAAELQEKDDRFNYVVQLLRNARDDLVALGERNRALEKQIHDMIVWEKTW